MAETTRNEQGQQRGDLAGAALDRGREQLEGAKGQLAEGAERIAAAVDRTADELDGEGGGAISGYAHSVAGLMRQLAGGLRERDIEEFAREIGTLARRNPGVFLAGSVALGFGIARFFKARPPRSSYDGDEGYRSSSYDSAYNSGRPSSQRGSDLDAREEFDVEESLDFSAGPAERSDTDGAAEQGQGALTDNERNSSKTRSQGKQRSKTQRASTNALTDEGVSTSSEPSSDGMTPAGGSQSGTTSGGKPQGGFTDGGKS